jgi:PhzF family phenazine biosynthesis protein
MIREGPVEPELLGEIALALGVDLDEMIAARRIDNGPGWVGVILKDADRVRALQPDFTRATTRDKLDIGVIGMYPEGWETLYEVRAFFSGERGEMIEDPVTGSLNASIAQWLISDGMVRTPYVASQGTVLGRTGRVHISGEPGSVWVGGRVFDIVEGHLTVDL